MDPWTPADRDEFIAEAVQSGDKRGQRGPYHFKVYPKTVASDIDDPKKKAFADALARVIYQGRPEYKAIALKFYELLVEKIRVSAFVNRYFMSTFFILLKGGTCYRMLLGDAFANDFQYSDLDIVIYINPYIDAELFDNLKSALQTILMQVMSQYKRILDHMFFLNKPTPEWFLNEDTIKAFKEDVKKEMEKIVEFDGNFMSPFENDEIRNTCSKHSFMMKDSTGQENSVVRVEVPHFPKCERIPLRKTPILASYNSTISFNRDQHKQRFLAGEFDLFRLKFTGVFVGIEGDDDSIFEDKISADFIDVSIANRNDVELQDFWNHGRCLNLYIKELRMWVVVPDHITCMNDLYKMLYVYECPENKREKREKRYNIFRTLCQPMQMIAVPVVTM